jgi:hypothetical protein
MMRVVHDLPMESLGLKQGIAWYAGTQNRDNSINAPPPVPYLCDVPAAAVPRARWAARTGLLRVEGRDLMVHYFVDPETQRLFAQPHPDFLAASQRDWGVADPHAQFPFELARDTARWIYRMARGTTKRHEQWWRDYTTGRKGEGPPIPFGLPVDPSDAYQNQGWISFKDWLVKPRPLCKRRSDKASKG